MKRFCLILLLALAVLPLCAAPTVRISGKVLEAGNNEPVLGAVVRLDENYLWAVTDVDGAFVITFFSLPSASFSMTS